MGKKRTDITVEGGLCTLEMSSVAECLPCAHRASSSQTTNYLKVYVCKQAACEVQTQREAYPVPVQGSSTRSQCMRVHKLGPQTLLYSMPVLSIHPELI